MEEAANWCNESIGAARQGTDEAIDLTNLAALRRALERLRPELIVNAAALTNFDTCEREPAMALTLNGQCVGVLADYCGESKAILVQISTDQYYTGDVDTAHDEEAPVRLLNEYARSKFAGEEHALAAHNSLVIRTNVTGWRGWPDRPTFLEWAVGMLESGDEVTAFGDYFTSTIDCRTLARATFELWHAGFSGLFNVASREVVSKKTFMIRLARHLGKSQARIVDGSVRTLGTNRAESCGLAVTKAEAALGYRLPDCDEVIRALLAVRTTG